MVLTTSSGAQVGGALLGGQRTSLDALDLRTIGASLRQNGRVLATGACGAVLGNPATALSWLANTVHRFGVTLDAGHVILPGSGTRACDVAAQQTIRADSDVLGSVTTRFEQGRAHQ
jgi:2-keto-4-pentenoate hydratase